MNRGMGFVKMHGAGNDFIMLNGIDAPPGLERELIAALCSRHRGIGADGLIVLLKSDEADFRMVYYNSDGGEAEMCGNGARCAARFAFETGAASNPMTFQTPSGIVGAEIRGELVEVGIGKVIGVEIGMRIAGIEEDVHFADSGVPHAVILHDDVDSIPADEFVLRARSLRGHDHFGSKGANVNFITVRGNHEVSFRTYERGVEDETEACGTGAAAVSVITAHLGLTSPPVTCMTSGGDQIVVGFERTSGGATNCTLLGPAVSVFEGTFIPEDYKARNP